MSEVPMKRYWMGRDVETLSREELLQIIDHLDRRLSQTSNMLKATINIHELAAACRKAA